MSLGLEWLEMRAVLSAAFDVAGVTSLRNDPVFSQIDGLAPDGRKIGVAILDTGVYGNHPDLRSNFVAYYDAVTKTAVTTNPAGSRDPGGHGTHVSGTVASSNPNYGVATRAGLIDVRVLAAEGERQPAHDPILEGLRWVAQVYQQYNIKVVNMSLGGGNYGSATPPLGGEAHAAAINALERLGITVVTASGNSWAQYQQEGSAFPGNVSTLTIANTWATSYSAASPQDALRQGQGGGGHNDSFYAVELNAVPDQLAATSQRSGSLQAQLAAPGMNIVSTSSKGGTETMSGTSMASPLVSGVVALMQDAAQTFGGRWLTATEVRSILKSSADTIIDAPTTGNGRFPVGALADRFLSASEVSPLAETGRSFLRVNALRAVQAVRSLLGGGSAPVPGQDLNGTMSTAVTVPDLDGTRVFRALGSIGSDGNTSVGANDVDLVRIRLTSPGSISIRVDPDPNGRSFDPYLRLFDASGQQLAAVDDTNGNYPVLQSVTLPAGTYYAGVSSHANTTYGVSSATGRTGGGSQGEYVFTVTLENPDPNGVMAGAAPANEWVSVPGGTLGYFWARGEIGSDPPPVDGSPRVPVGLGDVDMFEVVAPDTGWLNIAVYSQQGLFFPSPNPFDAVLRVFDENGALLTWADNSFNVTDPFVQMWANRGQRLFVGVSAAFNASYSATSPYGRPQVAGTGSYEIAHWFDTRDANGSAWAAVDAAVLGSTIQGEIGRDFGNFVGLDGTKDVDFVSYTAQQTGMLDVTVAGQSGFVPAVTLWKWDPNQKNVVRLAERVDTSVNHRVAVQAGEVYYVSVTGAGNMGYQWFATASGTGGMTGFYAITGSIQATSAVWQTQDDTFQGVAIPSLAGNDVRFGDLGLDGTLYRGATDVDLYQFQPQASGSVAFSAHGDGAFGASPVLRLFDAWGNELAFSQSSIDGRNGSTLEYDVVGGQAYYVGVSGWAESGDMRGYQPNGTLSTVSASTGSYVLSTSSNTTAGPSLDTIGFYQPGNSLFHLKDTFTPGASDQYFQFGPTGTFNWPALAGDWNGDGTTTVGFYQPDLSLFHLKNTFNPGASDVYFQFGPSGFAGWTPLVGDWDGDGLDTVGFYQPDLSLFHLKNSFAPGNSDIYFQFGPSGFAGWTPLVGDWDGDGFDTVGFYQPDQSLFHLKNSFAPGNSDIYFQFGPSGHAGWTPLVGDWNGRASGLSVAGEAAAGRGVAANALPAAAIEPIVAQAMANWQALGLSVRQEQALRRVRFVVADLSGARLGLASGNVVRLDRDAAGHGWFIDATPSSHEEFQQASGPSFHAVDPRARDRVDLLTVVEHELGHVLGLDDLDPVVDDLMAEELPVGVRRTKG